MAFSFFKNSLERVQKLLIVYFYTWKKSVSFYVTIYPFNLEIWSLLQFWAQKFTVVPKKNGFQMANINLLRVRVSQTVWEVTSNYCNETKTKLCMQIIQNCCQLFFLASEMPGFLISEVYAGLSTKNSVWSQFILNGSNGIIRGKLFFLLFSCGCFTKETTFFKSCWKCCYGYICFIISIYGLATYHWLQLHNNGMNNFLTNIQGQAIRMYTVTLKWSGPFIPISICLLLAVLPCDMTHVLWSLSPWIYLSALIQLCGPWIICHLIVVKFLLYLSQLVG